MIENKKEFWIGIILLVCSIIIYIFPPFVYFLGLFSAMTILDGISNF